MLFSYVAFIVAIALAGLGLLNLTNLFVAGYFFGGAFSAWFAGTVTQKLSDISNSLSEDNDSWGGESGRGGEAANAEQIRPVTQPPSLTEAEMKAEMKANKDINAYLEGKN